MFQLMADSHRMLFEAFAMQFLRPRHVNTHRWRA